MRNKILLCSLLFASVFSFSFGFHAVLYAGDNPDPGFDTACVTQANVGNCCTVNAETGQLGVCVATGSGEYNVVCECTCLRVPGPTCGGPQNCEYDICPIGGGS